MTPTGDCYKAAGSYISRLACSAQEEGYTLVHGVVNGQGSLAGRRIGHAWVEVDDGPVVMVVDVSNDRHLVMPRDAYYQLGRVVPEECRRYTPEEAIIEMVRSRHWGPWEDKTDAA